MVKATPELPTKLIRFLGSTIIIFGMFAAVILVIIVPAEIGEEKYVFIVMSPIMGGYALIAIVGLISSIVLQQRRTKLQNNELLWGSSE